jgi:hypothetical protein
MRRLLACLVVVVSVACYRGTPPGVVAVPPTIDQLKFLVIDKAGPPNYCDPDLYPIAREGGEQASAIAAYPQIQADAKLYDAILVHEHLPYGDLTDAQKLTVYRAYKLLRALNLTLSGDHYTFAYRATFGDSIQMVSGTVTTYGGVTITSRTPSGPAPCPICLAAATLIATPSGAVRVTDVRPGMLVWTASPDGTRSAALVLEVGSTPVPAGHLMVHLILADGRELLASPGHRSADGRQLGTLAVGDQLDGSVVTVWELVPYDGDRTYDLLPAGPTASYWADGIPLASTLQLTSAAGLAGVPPAMTLSTLLPSVVRRN